MVNLDETVAKISRAHMYHRHTTSHGRIYAYGGGVAGSNQGLVLTGSDVQSVH